MPGTSAAALLPAAAVLRCASTITIDSLWSPALYSLAYTIIGMLAQKPDSLSNRFSQASLALSRLLWPRYRLSCRPQSSRSSPNSTRSFLRNCTSMPDMRTAGKMQSRGTTCPLTTSRVRLLASAGAD